MESALSVNYTTRCKWSYRKQYCLLLLDRQKRNYLIGAEFQLIERNAVGGSHDMLRQFCNALVQLSSCAVNENFKRLLNGTTLRFVSLQAWQSLLDPKFFVSYSWA